MAAYLSVGDLLDGKYRIIRMIGEGGWGVVFEGENARTLRRVAIKVLRSHADVTPDIRARFEREAQAGGRIGSEHIVEVFDLGTLPDGTHFMVMELLTGEDLATRLRLMGPLAPMTAAKLVIQLLDGLAAAHNAGVLHRDLKPENLFLVPTRSGEDFVKILDFGVSKFSTPGLMSATRTGAVLGSPFYMAPEQARGLKQIDGRTDIYSVGALLFESVTGRVPFEGENFNDLMFKIALAPRPNPLHFRADLDGGLVSIIMKAIAADPRERFASAEDFRSALVAWLQGQGLVQVVTPELRQAKSPHHASTPSLVAPAATDPTSPRASPPGSPGAARDPLPAETPMASSSMTGRARRARRKRTLLVVVALLAVPLIGVVGLVRLAGRASPGDAAPARTAQVAASPPETTNLVAMPIPLPTLTPVREDPPLPGSAPLPSSAPAPMPTERFAPSFAAHPVAATAAARAAVIPPAAVSSPTPDASHQVEAVPANAPAATPPAASAASTALRPFQKIEGREVRTGL